MGRPPGWPAALTWRALMRSPGPPVCRDPSGRSGRGSHRGAGCRHSNWPWSREGTSFTEREDIALLRAQGVSMRAIANQDWTVAFQSSRDLRRNSVTAVVGSNTVRRLCSGRPDSPRGPR